MKDYKNGTPTGKKQKIARRGSGGIHPDERRWYWRTAGVVVFLALAVGLPVSLWLGNRIDSSLDELAIQQEMLKMATEQNRRLQQQQEQLLSEERVQEAVRKRGLHPPTAAQIKRM